MKKQLAPIEDKLFEFILIKRRAEPFLNEGSVCKHEQSSVYRLR
jgi:hypothetical protein